MLEGISLGSYLLLVDYTGRLFRDGKAAISRELSGISDQMGSSAENWWSRLEKLSKGLWADSSRRAECVCEKWREGWVCVTWRTWADARRDKAT